MLARFRTSGWRPARRCWISRSARLWRRWFRTTHPRHGGNKQSTNGLCKMCALSTRGRGGKATAPRSWESCERKKRLRARSGCRSGRSHGWRFLTSPTRGSTPRRRSAGPCLFHVRSVPQMDGLATTETNALAAMGAGGVQSGPACQQSGGTIAPRRHGAPWRSKQAPMLQLHGPPRQNATSALRRRSLSHKQAGRQWFALRSRTGQRPVEMRCPNRWRARDARNAFGLQPGAL